MTTIKTRSGAILYEHDGTLKETVEAAVRAGASLDGAHLDGAHLDRARLIGARLIGANLNGASLNGANLDGASLDRASLFGASLDRASLDRASLFGANLNEANLFGANLFGANLTGASLDGARLAGASLYRASLYGASLDVRVAPWGSHDFMAEILRHAAGDDVARLSLAGLVLIQRAWCWDDFLELENIEWALDELAQLPEAGRPQELTERIKEREAE